ncbi:MAG TPA: hypothetical protein VNE58_02420 [Casimicrobiaceae bacterium]|nr:hypothetical protein [Casimicrobiaceae bacterium]
MRKTIIAVLPLLLAGCQTWGPTWSEVSGSRYHRTDLNRSPTIIENVDGVTPLFFRSGSYRVARIEPGRHQLTLQGVPLRAGWQGTLQPYSLDAKPCQRYYINAQFDGPLQPSDWKPVIDYVEPIAGCGVAVAAK